MTKLKITFAPGSFDDFDGSQEELDEMIKSITDYLESDEFKEALASSDELPVDDWDDITQSFEKPNVTIH